jgi:hypothetical protein
VDDSPDSSYIIKADRRGQASELQAQLDSADMSDGLVGDEWEEGDPSDTDTSQDEHASHDDNPDDHPQDVDADSSTQDPSIDPPSADPQTNILPTYVPPFSLLDQPLPAPADVHPNSAVYIIYILFLWLHTMFHVPFRACNAILSIFAHILALNNTLPDPPILTTLPSVITTLGADPNFHILPVCPRCMQVHASTTAYPAPCKDCEEPLFHWPTHAPKPVSTPRLQFPHKTLEAQIREILSVPGMEGTLDDWRKLERQPGKYRDIFDGAVCKELQDSNGRLFFNNEGGSAPDNELRIGVTLGVDW